MAPPPLFANLTYLLVAATALLAVLFRLRGGERYRLTGLFPAMGALVALGIAFRLAGWEASVSNPVLFLFWAALVGGWGLVLGRGDDPGTLSSLFRFSCLAGAVGFLLLAVGSSTDPALGAGLLLLGSLVAIAGSWVFAASGIRGAPVRRGGRRVGDRARPAAERAGRSLDRCGDRGRARGGRAGSRTQIGA